MEKHRMADDNPTKIPEMVERVARALYETIPEEGVDEPWEELAGTHTADFWVRHARSAVAAMREPTSWRIDSPEGQAIMALRRPAYIEACRQTNCAERGFNESQCGQCAYCADIADHIIEVHSKAAIDAALKE
jgi:hypothetical protein